MPSASTTVPSCSSIRSRPDRPKDKWTLPGGGVDFGEEPADAAARECREETGLTPTAGVHSSTVDAFGEQWHSVRILFEGAFTGRRPAPATPDDGETDQVGWFPLEDSLSPVTEWTSLGATHIDG